MKKVLCLVLILLFAISITVYATPVKPDVPLTCSCGGTNVYMGTEVGNWSAPLSKMRCSHGHDGYDFKCSRNVTDYYECNLCSRNLQSSYKEVEWICGSEILPMSAVVTLNGGRAELCDNCGTTMSPYKTSYGPWEGPIETRQTPNGTLYKYQRTVNSFYRCPNCITPETTTYIEYKWSDMNM